MTQDPQPATQGKEDPIIFRSPWHCQCVQMDALEYYLGMMEQARHVLVSLLPVTIEGVSGVCVVSHKIEMRPAIVGPAPIGRKLPH